VQSRHLEFQERCIIRKLQVKKMRNSDLNCFGVMQRGPCVAAAGPQICYHRRRASNSVTRELIVGVIG